MSKNIKILALIVIFITISAGIFFYLRDYYFPSMADDTSLNLDTVKVSERNVEEEIKNAFNQGNLDLAISEAQNLVNKDGNDLEALLALASSYLQKGSLEFKEEEYGQKGLELANKIISLNPKEERGYFVKGYAYEIMEDYDNALIAYNKALELQPDGALILNQIGHVYDLMGDDEKAKEFYSKALIINPESVITIMNTARVDFNKKRLQKALDGFKLTLEKASNNRLKAEAAYMIGQIYLFDEMKNLIEAEKYMNQAVKLDSKFPLAYVGIGQVAFMEGLGDETTDFVKQMKKAENNFNKAISLNPNQTIAHVFKARLYIFTGNIELAEEEYRKALEVLNKDIVLMSDDKIKLKKDILVEMKMYNFSVKKISLNKQFINFITFQPTIIYAKRIKSHYNSRAEAQAAIKAWNSQLKKGESGHAFNSNGVCANGGRITWGNPNPCDDGSIETISQDTSCTDGSWDSWEDGQRTYTGSMVTKQKITAPSCAVSYKNIRTGCQITQTGTCDSTFYPNKADVCDTTNFIQSNSCGEIQEATGTKECNGDCTATTWTPTSDQFCTEEAFVQSSDCGTVRMALGTKKCGDTIKTSGPISMSVGSNFKIDLDLLCSLDNQEWSDCEENVWRLKSKDDPIYLKLLPTGSDCPKEEDPEFSSSLTPGVNMSFNDLTKVEETFTLNSTLSGDLKTVIFPKNIKASYCMNFAEVEKELQIKILNIDEEEN